MSSFTCVLASSVLNATEVPLGPDAHRVVRLGDHEAGRVVVVETVHHTTHPGEKLETSVRSCNAESHGQLFLMGTFYLDIFYIEFHQSFVTPRGLSIA